MEEIIIISKEEKVMERLRKNKGYTLTELIIVIAVIALFAAMIAPSIIKKIDKSKETRAVHACRTIYDAAVTVVATEYPDVSTDDSHWERILELAGADTNDKINIVKIKQDVVGNITLLTIYERGKYATFRANGLGYEVGEVVPADVETETETKPQSQQQVASAGIKEVLAAQAASETVADSNTNVIGTPVADAEPVTPVVTEPAAPVVTEPVAPIVEQTVVEPISPITVAENYQVPEEGEVNNRYPVSVTNVSASLNILPQVGTLNSNNNKNQTGVSNSTLNQDEVDRRITAALTSSFGTSEYNYEVLQSGGYRCLIVSVGHKYVKGDSDFPKNNSKLSVAVYVYRYDHVDKNYVFHDVVTGTATLSVANKKGDDGLKFGNLVID